jgi:hypothetical protein
MRDASLYAIDESADVFIEEMQKRIEESSPSGREYYHSGDFRLTEKPIEGGFLHIASAEGEPPAQLSGELLKSFAKNTFFSAGHTRIISHIENYARSAKGRPYPLYLEYGTAKTGWGGPIAPRPFMEPVMYDSGVAHKMLLRVRAAMKRAGQAYGAR